MHEYETERRRGDGSLGALRHGDRRRQAAAECRPAAPGGVMAPPASEKAAPAEQGRYATARPGRISTSSAKPNGKAARQETDKSGGDWLIDKPELEVKAGSVPGDAEAARLRHAGSADFRVVLCSGGERSGRPQERTVGERAQPRAPRHTNDLRHHRQGHEPRSLRQSARQFAEIVAEFNISGNSFRAAHDRVKRLRQEYRKRHARRS